MNKTIIIILVVIVIIFIITWIGYPYTRRKILRKMALDVFEILDKNDIEYWTDFGTLLGIIRENDIILYVNDVDISIIDNENNRSKMVDVAKSAKEKGYKLNYYDLGIYRIEKYIYFTDLILYKLDDDIYKNISPIEFPNIPKKYINPIIDYVWEKENITIKVPNDVHNALVWRYGDDYMTPKRGVKGVVNI